VNVSDEVIRQAFRLSSARGAELLALLGDFDVWRGDLAAMREDSPRIEQTAARADAPSDTRLLVSVLLMARAIEILDAECRTSLAKIYDRHDRISANSTSDSVATDAACRGRLIEIYTALQTHAAGAGTPEWISEREHAAPASSGSRRRG